MNPSDSEILEQSVIMPPSPHIGAAEYSPQSEDVTTVYPTDDLWMQLEQETLDLDGDDVLQPLDPSTAIESNSFQGDAALFEPYFDSVEDGADAVLPENSTATKHVGFGKFSIYFVMFSTVFVVALFAYALMELIRECRKKNSSKERELFCRVLDEEEDAQNASSLYNIEGVDPSSLLSSQSARDL